MVSWQQRFTRGHNFTALSLSDLADARDAYHVHLANLPNVVGTALGRYLIRDHDEDSKKPTEATYGWSEEPRTLSNSRVQPWSWPCVLVFVREWMTKPPVATEADQIVPGRIYLPDGRQVPICVVETAPVVVDRSPQISFASIPPGPGLPLFTETQGRRRLGTLGTLVTDGSLVYALTSRHVLGPDGSPVYMVDHGKMVNIGRAASVADNRSLQSLYPGIAATRAELSLDAGLVALNDLSPWTTQMYGLGPVGDLVDVNVDTVALSLIGCRVRAFGSATGPMRGTVIGLFHRWRSVGGVDQIAELMIGPRVDAQTTDNDEDHPAHADAVTTVIDRYTPASLKPTGDDQRPGIDSRPGDSGTVWVWDEDAENATPAGSVDDAPTDARPGLPPVHPLAIQWGGQVVLGPSGEAPTDYVLASTIASVAQTLRIALLHDDSLADHSLYWGKVGHYKIGQAACNLATPGTNLAALLQLNRDLISIENTDIKSGSFPSATRSDFVGLADVPDIVWRDTRPEDAANHFADMDEAGGAAVGNRTLMQLWYSGEAEYRTPGGWTKYYASLPHPPSDAHRGALPFRVAQLYQLMVDAVRAGNIDQYVAAAGVLAHYVGDACQPLHVSRFHHGVPGSHPHGDVHAAYEDRMLNQHAIEVTDGVDSALQGWHVQDDHLLHGSEAAAGRVVDLMRDTIDAVHPEDIVKVFDANHGRARLEQLWLRFGPQTILRLADGAKTLAQLWESAWAEAGGEGVAASAIVTQSQAALRSLYENDSFAPSTWLREMS